jgi:NIPSNAP
MRLGNRLGGEGMFYRRKYYVIKKEFIEIFNDHFNDTNLPNQLKHGSRLVGRWMKDNGDDTVEIFAIWEYDSYEEYVRIETNVRNDEAHLQRIQGWYEKHGGRAHVLREYIVEMRNEALVSTVRG